MPTDKTPEEFAEEIFEEADADADIDDLTRGTEVYEEDTDEYGYDDEPQELDFEPDDEPEYADEEEEDFIEAQDAIEDYGSDE